MVNIFWIVLIVLLFIVLIIALLLYGFAWMISNFMAPNTESDSINQLKSFLGYDFGEGYEIIEHNSQNNHPDRPLKLKVILSDTSFELVMKHLSQIESKTLETFSQDQTVRYVEELYSSESSLNKSHLAYHIHTDGKDYIFFSASFSFNCPNKTIEYFETFIS